MCGPSFNKLIHPSPEDALCCSAILLISPYVKRCRLSIWTNLNPLHTGMFFAKFCCNWPTGSGEGDFYISSMYFHYFLIISPWKKGRALHLNKLESPFSQNDLCQIWLKLAQWFWRRSFFFKYVNIFTLFRNYLPLEKGWTSFELTWIPFTYEWFVPSTVEIGPLILEKYIFKICQCIFTIS